MKNYFFVSSILVLLFVSGFIFAQDLSGVTFPVAELGDCQDQDACAAYCDKEENMATCLDFAEAHNLLPALEIKMARDMLQAGETSGPGGCQGQFECAAYCDEISHIKECISFAEEHNLIPAEELQDAKKVIVAIDKGLTPPNCKNKSECDIYCQTAEHMEECITFGEAAGIIPPEELGDAKKTLEAIKKGAKPPACQGKEACDAYCAEESHSDECIAFAEAAGFMTAEEAAMAKKTGGKGPGGCRGKEVCDAFCEDPANMEACMSFGLEYGFVPPEEIENTKKALEALKKGVKPPNCKGEEECQVYCSQPEHNEECINFAEAAGYMTPEDAAKAREGMQMMQQGGPGDCKGQQECQDYCNDVAHMEECLLFSYNAGLTPPEDLKNTEGIIGAIQKGVHMLPCRDEEECNAYCATPEHMEECTNFAEAAGFITSQESQQIQQQMMQAQQIQQMQPPGEGGGGGGGMMPPSSSTQPPTEPEKPAGTVNPTKCIEDCELVGNTCISQAAEEDKVCLSNGTYCRTVTCEALYTDAEGNRPTQEQFHYCNNTICTPTENSCHDSVMAKDSACRTTKDQCVTQCQKAAKGGKPIQPSQSTPPSQPSPPTQSGQFDQPTPPTPPSPPSQPTPPTEPTPPTPPNPPEQPSPPSPPSQPEQSSPPQP